MEKILLTIDAANPDFSSLDFAAYLGRLTKSALIGVFLENKIQEPKLKAAKVHAVHSGEMEAEDKIPEEDDKDELIEQNINLFKQACIAKEINCQVHRDRTNPFKELITESRFADLLIADAAISFGKNYEGVLTGFVKDILKHAECPVIIAPEKFNGINEIVFTYNNSASSVFAIKQFSYLFPQLNNKKVVILQVNTDGKWRDPEKYIFKEWLKDRYTDLHFEALKGETDAELFSYLLKRKDVFIVMGAYGRNTISQLFKSSQADLLIKTIDQPIFIAHR